MVKITCVIEPLLNLYTLLWSMEKMAILLRPPAGRFGHSNNIIYKSYFKGLTNIFPDYVIMSMDIFRIHYIIFVYYFRF